VVREKLVFTFFKSDLIWSDPMEDDEEDEDDEYGMFQFNELRNCSYTYSYTAVSTFLANNNLLSVCKRKLSS
jgi:serine/threonine-protein phosphatase 2B catalytic subunit